MGSLNPVCVIVAIGQCLAHLPLTENTPLLEMFGIVPPNCIIDLSAARGAPIILCHTDEDYVQATLLVQDVLWSQLPGLIY